MTTKRLQDEKEEEEKMERTSAKRREQNNTRRRLNRKSTVSDSSDYLWGWKRRTHNECALCFVLKINRINHPCPVLSFFFFVPSSLNIFVCLFFLFFPVSPLFLSHPKRLSAVGHAMWSTFRSSAKAILRSNVLDASQRPICRRGEKEEGRKRTPRTKRRQQNRE